MPPVFRTVDDVPGDYMWTRVLFTTRKGGKLAFCVDGYWAEVNPTVAIQYEGVGVLLRKEVETVMLVVECWSGKKSREEKWQAKFSEEGKFSAVPEWALPTTEQGIGSNVAFWVNVINASDVGPKD